MWNTIVGFVLGSLCGIGVGVILTCAGIISKLHTHDCTLKDGNVTWVERQRFAKRLISIYKVEAR